MGGTDIGPLPADGSFPNGITYTGPDTTIPASNAGTDNDLCELLDPSINDNAILSADGDVLLSADGDQILYT